ncbi:hypothetical protein ACFW16_06930 [Inquilinus sp. NPDC058860]|uniref:hypothetical protein n=1 Tax=Inquilinus sp. NPDC058860 TaxID=3346652 RepID=UPI0036780112
MTARSLPLAAVLVLLSATAGAQQVLVPAGAAQAGPGWPETSRTAQVIRQQLQPAPALQPPLGGAEAGRIYQNYLQGIGRPVQGSGNGYSGNSGFGGNSMSSGVGAGYGAPQ